MGFFSWITKDTKRSISNRHSGRKTFTVNMKDNKGNFWKESSYDGYGVFGGKDYYELVAEMNGYGSDRNKGIQIELGITGIKNKETNKIYLSSNIDFFNWGTEILEDGKSANDLLDTKKWTSIIVHDQYAKFPNFVEDEKIKWENIKPKRCPDQGFF